jgi:hypothetical protein
MLGLARFELAVIGLKVHCFTIKLQTQMYSPDLASYWQQRELNPQPLDYEPTALPLSYIAPQIGKKEKR